MASGSAVEAVGHERDVGALRGRRREPAAPIATPTRAAASAGASLTPSPTIATAPASRSSACDVVELVGGQQARVDFVDAGRAARSARATGSVSPVSITTRSMPAARSALRRGRRPRRAAGRRGRTARAGGRPRRARSPSRRASCSAASAAGSAPSRSLHQPRAAGPQRAAVDGGLRAAARAARRSASAGGTGETAVPRRAAQRGGQRMLGAALDGRDERQRRGFVRRPMHALQLREPERERAGLVERDRARRGRGPRAPGRP